MVRSSHRRRLRHIGSAAAGHGLGHLAGPVVLGRLAPFQRGWLGHERRAGPYTCRAPSTCARRRRSWAPRSGSSARCCPPVAICSRPGTGLAAQFVATLRAELDYVEEGHNAERIATNFADDPCTSPRCTGRRRDRGSSPWHGCGGPSSAIGSPRTPSCRRCRGCCGSEGARGAAVTGVGRSAGFTGPTMALGWVRGRPNTPNDVCQSASPDTGTNRRENARHNTGGGAYGQARSPTGRNTAR